MSGLREKQKETRRQAMLAAAAKLFKEQGFAKTSMEEIAAAAGAFGRHRIQLLQDQGRDLCRDLQG